MMRKHWLTGILVAFGFVWLVACVATAVHGQALQLPKFDRYCVFAVNTPKGTICVKRSGEVDVPEGLLLSDAARRIWEEVGKQLRLVGASDVCA